MHNEMIAHYIKAAAAQTLSIVDLPTRRYTLSVKDDSRKQLERELAELRRELKELEASLPKHSVKSTQLIRIEELEDAIAEKEAALARLG
jgi:septal ring factor EnvC (AmiA/AmiB activator)